MVGIQGTGVKSIKEPRPLQESWLRIHQAGLFFGNFHGADIGNERQRVEAGKHARSIVHGAGAGDTHFGWT